MTEFRAGDVVECVEAIGADHNPGSRAVIRGDRYLIGSVLDGGHQVMLTTTGFTIWNCKRFRLLFRKGDVVEVVTVIDRLRSWFPSGTGVLTHVLDTKAGEIRVNNLTGGRSWGPLGMFRAIERDGVSLGGLVEPERARFKFDGMTVSFRAGRQVEEASPEPAPDVPFPVSSKPAEPLIVDAGCSVLTADLINVGLRELWVAGKAGMVTRLLASPGAISGLIGEALPRGADAEWRSDYGSLRLVPSDDMARGTATLCAGHTVLARIVNLGPGQAMQFTESYHEVPRVRCRLDTDQIGCCHQPAGHDGPHDYSSRDICEGKGKVYCYGCSGIASSTVCSVCKGAREIDCPGCLTCRAWSAVLQPSGRTRNGLVYPADVLRSAVGALPQDPVEPQALDSNGLRKLVEGRRRFTTHTEAVNRWCRDLQQIPVVVDKPTAGPGVVPDELLPEGGRFRDSAQRLLPKLKRAVGAWNIEPEPVLRPGWDHVTVKGDHARYRELVELTGCSLDPLEPLFYLRGDVVVFRSVNEHWQSFEARRSSARAHAGPLEAMRWAERELLS